MRPQKKGLNCYNLGMNCRCHITPLVSTHFITSVPHLPQWREQLNQPKGSPAFFFCPPLRSCYASVSDSALIFLHYGFSYPPENANILKLQNPPTRMILAHLRMLPLKNQY
jgi:hypothetical protein